MKGRRKRQFTILAVMLFAFFIAFSGSPKHAFAVSPGGEKAITLLKEGEAIGDYNTINQVIDKMYDLTKDGSKYNFVVQVNKDIELTEYSQFGFPYGEVTLTSKDPANPRTIKANSKVHNMMLGVVNGAHLTVEDIIIDGNNAKRLFWMESTEALPASLTINKGAILENGKVEASDQTRIGGGIYCQGAGDLTINGGIIRNNEAIQAGGAIAYIGKGILTINGGEITGNKVPTDSGFGGAIVLQGKGLIKGGKIYKNTAYDGGGIATGKNTNLEITGGEISENTASYAGGGIYCFKNSVVKLTGGQVSKNKGKYGGGVTAAFNSNFIMEGNGVISENEAYTGGGFYPWGTTPSCDLKSGIIEKNKANYGGGIRLRSPKAKIGGVVIQENIANFGGGIYSSLPEGETLTIDGVKLYKNEALSGGGVCLTDETGSLNFKNAEFKENKAYYGGGIWTSNTMTIEKSTFDGNEAIKSEPSILPDGKHENNGHGGAIYVNTALAKDGVVTVDGCTFTKNKADKSGGAISVDETHGLLKVINNTVFDGNEATGELGHGGAIYSNLHAYMPEYDDGTTGGLVQPPTAKDFYYNINTDATTVFKNNKAFQTFTPPSTKDEFVKLLYQSTSHPGTKYDHPLNNDDVNLLVFKEVIFHKNYETEDPIHDAFLVLEKSKLEDFPTDPVREGYIFKGWNTQKDGKGTEFKPGAVIEDDITVYAQWEADPTKPDPNKPDKPTPGGGFYFVPTDTPLLNRKDHAQYMIGYPDQNFKPDNHMSRQEVTVMFSRLLNERPQKGIIYSRDYKDIPDDLWSVTAISYMSKLGMVKGYPDGNFMPRAAITRAEFAAMATRFADISAGSKTFTDVSQDHWAYDVIQKAAEAGWISGYPDGSFKPDQPITRAEVVAITNRMLNRFADEAYVDAHQDKILQFKDMKKGMWSYYPVVEATNGHGYERKANGKDETWFEVNGTSFVYDK
ncbi:S-layer homology domain-containing protein [Aedoeadaptatus pacaensis]|uniref:S-layer homology domain-containing protein n=1 Tax=Aedoeadaptatus pacaensis TaxID=1776390 RepID=UPI0008395E73|nr:S-layer homology domain-containing protein [Peptoniphilus pacaensis]